MASSCAGAGNAGSINLADQKQPIAVPRVADQRGQREVPLATYAVVQTPRAHDAALASKNAMPNPPWGPSAFATNYEQKPPATRYR